MKTLLMAAVAALTLSAAGAASATVLTFDDVAMSGGYQGMPAGYGGYTWTNFALINGPNYGPSGYTNGIVSGNQTACACAGDFGQTIDTLTHGGGVFDLNSGYFTSAWNDGATILINGFLGGNLVYTYSTVLNTNGPAFLNLAFLGIDKAEFSISGGTPSGLPGSGNYFGVDNLSVNAGGVPEPATWALMISGFGLAGAALRRRKLATA